MSKFNGIIKAINKNRSVTSSLGNLFKGIIGNIGKKYFGLGLTDAEKEAADLSLRNQQTLNQEDYQRKLDFYEQFESPEAQVRQYKEAGLNPALMYGNGASVSASGGVGAGSSDVPSPSGGDLLGVLSSVLGVFNQKKKIANDFELQSQRNEIDKQAMMNQAEYLKILGQNVSANTVGTQLNNDYLQATFLTRVQGAQNEADVKKAMIDNFTSMVEHRTFENALLNEQSNLTRSQIGYVSASTKGQMLTNAVLYAQSKYADEYFKATANLQTALATAQGFQNTFLSRTVETRIKQAEYELSDLIIRAGMDARVYNGEAFEKEVQGRMTNKEKVQFWTGTATAAVKTATTAALGLYGMSAMSAGRASMFATPSFVGGVEPVFGLPGM